MWVLTIPAGAVDPDSEELPLDKLPRAEAVAEARREEMGACAAAKPIRADTMTDLEKYILIVVLLFFTKLGPSRLLVSRTLERMDVGDSRSRS
jgi:hypothetical protein